MKEEVLLAFAIPLSWILGLMLLRILVEYGPIVFFLAYAAVLIVAAYVIEKTCKGRWNRGIYEKP